VRASAAPVPLEALADRALRALGHEKTIATGWAGAGSFRELLRRSLPEEIKLTGDPPYLAFDAKRHGDDPTRKAAPEPRGAHAEARPAPSPDAAAAALRQAEPGGPHQPAIRPARADGAASRPAEAQAAAPRTQALQQAPVQRGELASPRRPDAHSAIQQAIARIHEACQAPPLAPQEYRVLFEIMAKEISDNDLTGVQTLANIAERAQERGIELRRDDVRFVLEVVSEADPWFEQGASADVFAARFRNFVVARCRGQGLNLSAGELDLIDAWFAGAGLPAVGPARLAPPGPGPGPGPDARAGRWWSLDDGRPHKLESQAADQGASAADELPRTARSRLRG
jgi:hypothetical protein